MGFKKTVFTPNPLQKMIMQECLRGEMSAKEYVTCMELAEDYHIPAIPEKVADNGGYIGKHSENISVYDAMMAEIMGEKERRLRKYLRKHEIRHGDPVRKEKRKAYIKEKCFTYDPWRGWGTVAEFRRAEKIRTDAEDWKLESEEIALDAQFEYWRSKEKAENLNEWLKYA